MHQRIDSKLAVDTEREQGKEQVHQNVQEETQTSALRGTGLDTDQVGVVGRGPESSGLHGQHQ